MGITSRILSVNVQVTKWYPEGCIWPTGYEFEIPSLNEAAFCWPLSKDDADSPANCKFSFFLPVASA